MSNSDQTLPPGSGSKPPHSGSAYKGVGQQIKHSIQDLKKDVIETALRIPDAAVAVAKLIELTTSAFMAEFGGQMTSLDREIITHQDKLVATQAELTDTKDELTKTPERLAASQANRNREYDDRIEEPIWDWQFRHKVESGLLVITMVIAIAASALTAHANLVGTGLPVFIDNGGLVAWTMASLAPLSGFAIKTIYEQLHSPSMRSLFQLSVIGLMVVSIVLWIFLYASSYHGLSADTSVSGLFEEPSFWDGVKETAFICVSLSTEILIGAVLAIRLTIIAGCYSPDYSHDNPDHKRLINKEKALTAQVDELQKGLAKLEGERVEFDHSLNLQIHLWTLAHDGRRGANDTPIL